MPREPLVAATIADIAAPHRNALVGGPFGSNLVSRDYVPDGVPVIRGANLGHGRWIGGEFVYVSHEKATSLAANCASPGDLIFTQRGTLGQVAIVPPDGFDRYLVSQSQMKLTVDPDKVDPLYLYYIFSTDEMQAYIKANAIQTGVPHTNLGVLRETPIRLPPLATQRRVTTVLGALDDKIELNRHMNETLEAMARALFKSWFVDFDPVRAKMEGRAPFGMDAATAALFPDTMRGDVPHGWLPSTLGDVTANADGDIQTGPFGSQLHAKDYVEHGLPVIMPTNIRGRRVAAEDIVRVTSEDAQRLSRHQLEVGDLVYSRRGDVEKHAIIGPEERGWLCGTGCLRVRPRRTHTMGPSPHYLSL